MYYGRKILCSEQEIEKYQELTTQKEPIQQKTRRSFGGFQSSANLQISCLQSCKKTTTLRVVECSSSNFLLF
jgi:hypothetical protein